MARSNKPWTRRVAGLPGYYRVEGKRCQIYRREKQLPKTSWGQCVCIELCTNRDIASPQAPDMSRKSNVAVRKTWWISTPVEDNMPYMPWPTAKRHGKLSDTIRHSHKKAHISIDQILYTQDSESCYAKDSEEYNQSRGSEPKYLTAYPWVIRLSWTNKLRTDQGTSLQPSMAHVHQKHPPVRLIFVTPSKDLASNVPILTGECRWVPWQGVSYEKVYNRETRLAHLRWLCRRRTVIS